MKKSRGPKANPHKTSFEEEQEDELEYSSPEERDDDYGSEEDEEDEEGEQEEEVEIKRALADVTFGELQEAHFDGSNSVFRKSNSEKKPSRVNKNRPLEASCKKLVGRFREVVQAPRKVVCDPQFGSLCGTLDVEGFRKRFNFLFKKNLPAEREELQKQLKKTRNPKVIGELKNHISWIDQQMKLESTKGTDAKILAGHKKKERGAAKHGKRPFYLKKLEIRKQRLIEKYNNLKAFGQLESFLEKRRRKNAAQDHICMPYRRLNDIKQ